LRRHRTCRYGKVVPVALSTMFRPETLHRPSEVHCRVVCPNRPVRRPRSTTLRVSARSRSPDAPIHRGLDDPVGWTYAGIAVVTGPPQSAGCSSHDDGSPGSWRLWTIMPGLAV